MTARLTANILTFVLWIGVGMWASVGLLLGLPLAVAIFALDGKWHRCVLTGEVIEHAVGRSIWKD